MVEMKDVSLKEVVGRKVVSSGKIFLKEETLEKIRDRVVEKGDVLTVAEIAGINAVKQAQYLIPLCHQVLVEKAAFNFLQNDDHIEVNCVVHSTGKTGVEMEALIGVSIALNTIWDMVKYLEKDGNGQYPNTRITDIQVVEKKIGV